VKDVEKRGRLLIAEIKGAFADVEYPGDDRIGAFPGDEECVMLALDFRGKHWSGITAREIASGGHHQGLLLMTVQAFVFYLPAYLLACVVEPRGAGLDYVIDLLTGPESEDPSRGAFSEEKVRALDCRQRVAVRHFLEYIIDRYAKSDEFLVEDVERALKYWRQLTANGPGAGCLA